MEESPNDTVEFYNSSIKKLLSEETHLWCQNRDLMQLMMRILTLPSSTELMERQNHELSNCNKCIIEYVSSVYGMSSIHYTKESYLIFQKEMIVKDIERLKQTFRQLKTSSNSPVINEIMINPRLIMESTELNDLFSNAMKEYLEIDAENCFELYFGINAGHIFLTGSSFAQLRNWAQTIIKLYGAEAKVNTIDDYYSKRIDECIKYWIKRINEETGEEPGEFNNLNCLIGLQSALEICDTVIVSNIVHTFHIVPVIMKLLLISWKKKKIQTFKTVVAILAIVINNSDADIEFPNENLKDIIITMLQILTTKGIGYRVTMEALVSIICVEKYITSFSSLIISQLLDVITENDSRSFSCLQKIFNSNHLKSLIIDGKSNIWRHNLIGLLFQEDAADSLKEKVVNLLSEILLTQVENGVGIEKRKMKAPNPGLQMELSIDWQLLSNFYDSTVKNMFSLKSNNIYASLNVLLLRLGAMTTILPSSRDCFQSFSDNFINFLNVLSNNAEFIKVLDCKQADFAEAVIKCLVSFNQKSNVVTKKILSICLKSSSTTKVVSDYLQTILPSSTVNISVRNLLSFFSDYDVSNIHVSFACWKPLSVLLLDMKSNALDKKTLSLLFSWLNKILCCIHNQKKGLFVKESKLKIQSSFTFIFDGLSKYLPSIINLLSTEIKVNDFAFNILKWGDSGNILYFNKWLDFTAIFFSSFIETIDKNLFNDAKTLFTSLNMLTEDHRSKIEKFLPNTFSKLTALNTKSKVPQSFTLKSSDKLINLDSSDSSSSSEDEAEKKTKGSKNNSLASAWKELSETIDVKEMKKKVNQSEPSQFQRITPKVSNPIHTSPTKIAVPITSSSNRDTNATANEFALKLLTFMSEIVRSEPSTNVKFTKVPSSSFINADAYINTFKPLLLEEARASLQQGYDANTATSVSQGVAVIISASSDSVCEDFTIICFEIVNGSAQSYTQNDILLFTSVINSEHSSAFSFPSILVTNPKTEKGGGGGGRRNTDTFFVKMKSFIYNKKKETLSSGKRFNLLKIENATTSLREYEALSAFQASAWSKYIVSPSTIKPSKPYSIANSNLNQTLTQHFNDSQMKAIQHASSPSSLICLIQGPPGTGKTHTANGILSSLLFVEPLISTLSKKTARDKLDPLPSVKDRKHVLLCAPSNTAIDELIQRLIENGLFVSKDSKRMVDIVRLGTCDSTNPLVRETCLSYKMEIFMNKMKAEQASSSKSLYELQKSLKDVNSSLQEYLLHENGSMKSKNNAELQTAINTLKKKEENLKSQIEKIQNDNKVGDKQRNTIISQHRRELLMRAEIIASTCSSSASGELSNFSGNFEALIIDEAAQSTELTNLVPLMRHNCERLILIGDCNQLPATIISQMAMKYNFDQSLMQRIQITGYKPILLNKQYRMHPDIRVFPSLSFYDNKIIDGEGITEASRSLSFHSHPLLKPYLFFDVEGLEERRKIGNASVANLIEVKFVVDIILYLLNNHRDEFLRGTIGVITPYKRQANELKNLLLRSVSPSDVNKIEIDTVDGFQGNEKDIIILSCVRAENKDRRNTIGFLSDERRMNVALTRARKSLWVVGDSRALNTDKRWSSLIENSKSRDLFISVGSDRFNDLVERNKRESKKRTLPAIDYEDYEEGEIITTNNKKFKGDCK